MKNSLQSTIVGVELLYLAQDAPFALPSFKVAPELLIKAGFSVGEKVQIYAEQNSIILMRNE